MFQAASYYEKAVSHDCAKAMYNLALLQMKGLVTEKSDSTKLIIKAAKLNHTKVRHFINFCMCQHEKVYQILP